MSMQDASNLSDEQIDCAFDYFLLYDRKLQQMEGSLDDPEALRHLLNDKQNDLELAAQIGKSLLERNRDLGRQLRESEQQMADAMETINQLQHTLGIKEELLQMWSDQSASNEDLPSDDVSFSDLKESQSFRQSGTFGKNGGQTNPDEIELIHRKLQALEEENASIRNARRDEQQAVTLRECLSKLGDAMVYMKNLSDEQFRRSDALIQQQTQVNALAARSRELENSLNQVGLTNEILASKVEELNAVNQSLVRELRDMKDKYDESVTLYAQAQAMVRKLRDRSRRASLRPTCLLYSPLGGKQITPALDVSPSPPGDEPLSIADEIASSSQEKSTQPMVAAPPPDLHSPLVVDGGAEKQPNQVSPGTRGENECCEWDDPTIDSSGFASCSEPIDSAHRTPRRRIEVPSPSSAAVLLNEQSLSLQHGVDWDIDDVYRGAETEADEEESSELVRAFAQCHTSPQPALTNRKVLHSKLRSTQGSVPPPSTRESSMHRRSWVIDQNVALPSQRSFDDSTLRSTVPSSLFVQAIRPQRLQFVKQLQGSGVLQRWQHLATPSLTAAIYARPLSGVASRGGILPPDSAIPSLLAPLPVRCASGDDLNRTPFSGDEEKFVPISRRPAYQYSGVFASGASTDRLLNEFLANSQRTRPLVVAAARVRPAAVGVRCPSPTPQAYSRQTPSSTQEVAGFRAVSPVCRGLLDASEMASEPLVFSAATIKVPAPRPASPQAPTLSPFRRHNISRASPTLHSVREEASSSRPDT